MFCAIKFGYLGAFLAQIAPLFSLLSEFESAESEVIGPPAPKIVPKKHVA
jgi:hypothetical protein